MAFHEIEMIDYEEIFLESGLFGFKISNDGAKLLSNLLNDVNNQLCGSIERTYNLEPKLYEIYYRAKKAIEEVFVGSTVQLALSEAFRQLALFESGYITYRDDQKESIKEVFVGSADELTSSGAFKHLALQESTSYINDSGPPTLAKEFISDKPETESHSLALGKLNFETAIADILPVYFQRQHISLERDAKMMMCKMIEEICDALVCRSIAVADSSELDLKDIKVSMCELFPKALKDLAEVNGKRNVLAWEYDMAKPQKPTF